MRKLIMAVGIGSCAFFGLAAGAGPVSAETDVPVAVTSIETTDEMAPVDVQQVSGLLDEIQAQAIEDAMVRAENDGAQALILQMNTRAAVVSRDRMETLLENMVAAKVTAISL